MTHAIWMTLNNTMLSKEALYKSVYTRWLYLYEVLEQAKQITVEKIQWNRLGSGTSID